MSTIFALASAQGRAGVAVIRLSGPDALTVAGGMAGREIPAGGRALVSLRSAQGEFLDQALVLSFVAPHSFTGEDVAEFHVHGSNAVVQAVLRALSEFPEMRLAEPGEFTRRALENGKMDLTQVEGLADLIEAETELQRTQAQATLRGSLGELAETWRSNLIRAASLIEVTIDFADEEVPVDVIPEVSKLLEEVEEGLRQQILGYEAAERIRSGFEVAIVGPPNAGKSTLLNRLAGREAAITSEYAGTTRDVIEVRMDLSGLAVTLLDTAGLRETDDFVEGIGIGRARERANAADLRVFLTSDPEKMGVQIDENDLCVSPKADISKPSLGLSVSGITGEGVSDLVQAISAVLAEKASGAGLATRERHRSAMVSALESLGSAREILRAGESHYDLGAEELRRSVLSLERLIGKVDVENLLDEIFSRFCLGK